MKELMLENLKTSTFKPCDVLCRLGSGLDNVDGVEAMFSKRTFRLSMVLLKSCGKGAETPKTDAKTCGKVGPVNSTIKLISFLFLSSR